MENKVYCKNCKHFKNYATQGGGDDSRCARRKPKELYNKYNGKFNTYELFSLDSNENGDCKFYRKKWWKFWV